MNERPAAGGGNTGWGKEINMAQACVVAVVVTCLCVAVAHGAEQGDVSVVERIPTASRNAHYSSTREPLVAVPLVKLPVGAVRPRGWRGPGTWFFGRR